MQDTPQKIIGTINLCCSNNPIQPSLLDGGLVFKEETEVVFANHYGGLGVKCFEGKTPQITIKEDSFGDFINRVFSLTVGAVWSSQNKSNFDELGKFATKWQKILSEQMEEEFKKLN